MLSDIEQEFVLTLTLADLSTINDGLQEVRLRLAAPLIAKINAQIAEQKVLPPGEQNPA